MSGEALPVPPRERRRKRWKRLQAVALAAILIVAAGLVIRVERHVLAIGYVTTTEYAQVFPAVSGAVAEIVMDSGEDVQAGDVLVRLEASRERALRDEAVSRAGKAEAELLRREAEIVEERRQREALVVMAQLRLQRASARLQLAHELSDKGLTSGTALEDERLNEQLARAELDALRTADETLPGMELTVLEREVQAARAAGARAEAELAARHIRAPIAGRVLRYGFVRGELVRPDTVVYEVFGGDGQVLKLRVPERYATLIASGQPYRAQLRSYQGPRRVWFTGTVERLRDVIETENQRTYRIIFCTFDPQGHPVPPGTTAEASIRVGRTSLWAHLFGL